MTADATTRLAHDLAARLRGREAELRELLRETARAGEDPAEVIDFKDIAAEDALAVVDEVTHAHALRELGEVCAALRRIDAGTYGTCESCGEHIDERRLHALPATGLCTACQADLERVAAHR